MLGPFASRRGFTMVEILTVIGIIVMFLGISVPVVTTIVSSRGLRGAALTTQLALQQARNAAITQRAYVSVIFDHVKGEGNTPDHYRIRITGAGQAQYYPLPPTVVVGGEVVEVPPDQATDTNPPRRYPVIFSPDGSLVPQVKRPGLGRVNLWDPRDGGRIIILRDTASEPFTDKVKTYFGNTVAFKNNVFDAYDPADGFLEAAPGDPAERRKIDFNLDGIPDTQIYVIVEPYTGHTYITEGLPDAWYF